MIVNVLSLLNQYILPWNFKKDVDLIHPNCKNISSLVYRFGDVSNQMAIFNFEDSLLKSSSLFPYFMLVAFEAGGFLRALILFFLYPFICLAGEKMRLNIMVFLCFVGIRRQGFRAGKAVLPKFFLEDIGYEGLEVITKFQKKVAASELPTVMVEGVLKDYLGVDDVVGRELKVFCGFFLGLMKVERHKTESFSVFGDGKRETRAVGIGSFNKLFDHGLLSTCKEVYLVTTEEKRKWRVAPREKYPQPLIFHDGRLAFRPTPFATLALLVWLPLGCILCIIRLLVGVLLPYNISSPLLALTGMKIQISCPDMKKTLGPRRIIYVSNHKTVIDPVYISIALKKPVPTVTYSISRFTKLISPIKSFRLTREREKDRELLDRILTTQGHVVIFPEGTTCRESYLLRFSPLFAEISDEIVPVAIDLKVSMFYGTTAGGYKCLDTLFHCMNPSTTYSVKILDKLPCQVTCGRGGRSKFEVANYVQKEIGAALGFECTSFTRKDKYMILAGNKGIM